jgi:hypothetical protein
VDAALPVGLPTFTVVATDRAAAKALMCEQIDNMFDAAGRP